MEQYIDALNKGKIISVDWNSIDEMLGETPKRLHLCSICTNDNRWASLPIYCRSIFCSCKASIRRSMASWLDFHK